MAALQQMVTSGQFCIGRKRGLVGERKNEEREEVGKEVVQKEEGRNEEKEEAEVGERQEKRKKARLKMNNKFYDQEKFLKEAFKRTSVVD